MSATDRIQAFLKSYAKLDQRGDSIQGVLSDDTGMQDLTVTDIKTVIKALARAEVLLQATRDMLEQSDLTGIVLDPMEILTEYDGTQCDGFCLRDDIDNWFLEIGKEPNVITEIVTSG